MKKKDVYKQGDVIQESMLLAFNNAKKHIEAENKQVPFTYVKLGWKMIQICNN